MLACIRPWEQPESFLRLAAEVFKLEHLFQITQCVLKIRLVSHSENVILLQASRFGPAEYCSALACINVCICACLRVGMH